MMGKIKRDAGLICQGEDDKIKIYSGVKRMESYTDARILGAPEMKKMVMHTGNPTVDNLVFVEAQLKDGKPSSVFPCYITAFTEDKSCEGPEGRRWLMFQATVVQYRSQEYELVPIYLHEKEFGVYKNVWDKPPAESLRSRTPLLGEKLQ